MLSKYFQINQSKRLNRKFLIVVTFALLFFLYWRNFFTLRYVLSGRFQWYKVGKNNENKDFEIWISTQLSRSVTRIIENIGPPGSSKGCVVAAKSKKDPPYFYYWLRDGALVMRILLSLPPIYNLKTEEIGWDFVSFNSHLQTLVTLSVSELDSRGLGEPKFKPHGTTFNENWGRPQNDGPALRVSFSLSFLEYLDIHSELYNNDEKRRIVERIYLLAKPDLEMLLNTTMLSCFDLWEETIGVHYYTTAIQGKGLQDGAELARRIGDLNSAKLYHARSAETNAFLDSREFWDGDHFRATINKENNLSEKSSNLDISVILAALHSDNNCLSCKEKPSKENCNVYLNRLLATANALENSFAQIYPINWYRKENIGTAIGRYPEDKYYGGNPWFLTTLAMAQLQYRFAVVSISGCWKSRNSYFYAQKHLKNGDKFLHRVRYHSRKDDSGQLDEQFDRKTGYMLSASDLTWSHAALISAATERETTLRKFKELT